MGVLAIPDTTSLVHRDPKTIYLRQSNALTTAAYTLSRNEKRLVYLLSLKKSLTEVSKKKGDDSTYPFIMLSIRRFSEKPPRILAVISLRHQLPLNKREIVFYLPEEDGEDGEQAIDGLSWTVKRSVRPKRGITLLSFNAELVDLLRADGNYTGYFLSNVAKLNNSYSMRLYESLRQWISIKRQQLNSINEYGQHSVTFAIEWLINRYELPDSYKRMSDFRRRS